MMIRVKICGIGTVSDALMAVNADAIGLNFHRPSPRFVEYIAAKAIASALPLHLKAVGVFVNGSVVEILESATESCLAGVQTYSDSPLDFPFPVPHIPAFRVRDAADLASIQAYVTTCLHKPSAVLVDSHTPHIGGSGVVAPWHLLSGFDPGVPLILAGGLTPENVAEAIRIVRPHGVDVASGVESAPGVKDRIKVRDFIAAARAAFAAL